LPNSKSDFKTQKTSVLQAKHTLREPFKDLNQVNESSKTSLKDFASLKVLGIGSWGKVLLVRHRKTNELFAMKVIKKNKITSSKDVE
jgi:serine/threonine protein kinase